MNNDVQTCQWKLQVNGESILEEGNSWENIMDNVRMLGFEHKKESDSGDNSESSLIVKREKIEWVDTDADNWMNMSLYPDRSDFCDTIVC
jgi:hypothetical protein